ncbi:MAG: sulfotransferase domain-containing protein [Candidatus Electrothrix communis]|nr:MAG: sulfotransferase domain-containing protein [Candidatus Electrothrix communis]
MREYIDFFLKGNFSKKQTLINYCNKFISLSRCCVTDKKGGLLLNSMPKSGTHLLERIVSSLPGIQNSGFFYSHISYGKYKVNLTEKKRILSLLNRKYFVGTHMPFAKQDCRTLNELGYKHILLVRDPRSIVVSQYFHAINRGTNRLHDRIVNKNKVDGLWDIILGLEGLGTGQFLGISPVEDYYRSFCKWITEGVHLVSFESLIGEKGGGEREKQFDAIAGIARYLDIFISDEDIQYIVHRSFDSEANTFRSGKINEWKKHLTYEQEAYINNVLRYELIKLKYL